MSSPILKSFTFVPQPKPSSDLIIKRERMIARLEDQKKLLRTECQVVTLSTASFPAEIVPLLICLNWSVAEANWVRRYAD